ncbi:MAG: hypothetical protein ACKO1U_04610 [Bacteroidota bacterium]
MKYSASLLIALSILTFTSTKTHGQDMRLILQTVEVKVKEVTGNGITGDYRIRGGKYSDWCTLYDTDTLRIRAQYKLTANNSGRSQIKDSSVKLSIDYSVDFKGRNEGRKVEKMFYLDEERAFKGEEIFTITMSKYSNSVIRLKYGGRVTE